MVLIFHSFKGFSDLKNVWDESSGRLPGSRLTKSSPMSLTFITDLSVLVFNQMVLIFHLYKDFLDLEDFWDDLPVSRSRRLPGLPDDFQEVL
ncbi:hypothetical protein DY000_02003158 [Brassica cretica]|uniref:Uncharacterized protein n=1 Tax=Brassica cretica TaxID=69181 RepID=A0ABQ7CDH9_BRACR|nr:hypothetical protein DY000_02003158 [Brassica cretica]